MTLSLGRTPRFFLSAFQGMPFDDLAVSLQRMGFLHFNSRKEKDEKHDLPLPLLAGAKHKLSSVLGFLDEMQSVVRDLGFKLKS